MFGSNLKLFVIIISFLILISNFQETASQRKSSSSNVKNKDAGCIDGGCGNPRCPGLRKSVQNEKICENKECVGQCGRPQCQKNKPALELNEKCGDRDCHGECHKPECQPPPSPPKPCPIPNCRGECESPGCIGNKPENQPKKKPDTVPRRESKVLSCSSTKPPLSGSQSCGKLRPQQGNSGPLYTSFGENSQPTAQCARCSLQTTPDNAAVILTCYDCSDLKTGNCGGKKPTSGSEKNLSQLSLQKPQKEKSEVKSGCGANHQSSSGALKKSSSWFGGGSQESIPQIPDSHPVSSQPTAKNETYVYLVYYLEIANYTDTDANGVNYGLKCKV